MKECEICGKTYHAFFRKEFDKVLCRRHYDHFVRYGKALGRSIVDENEIIMKEDCAELLIHDRQGELSRVVLIDKEDIGKIKGVKWGCSENIIKAFDKESGQELLLHRFLVGCEPEMVVTHLNGDYMDNRKQNLKVLTRQERMLITKKEKSTGKIRGMLWSKEKEKWVVTIKDKGKSHFLGYFTDEKEAMKARLDAEIAFYGEHAPQRDLLEEMLGMNKRD